MEQIVISKGSDLSELLLRSLHPVISVDSVEQKKELLGINEVNIKLKSSSPIDLEIGDFCIVFGEKYTINKLPNPKKTGDNRFEYDITLESCQYDLLRVVMLNTDSTSFSTGPDFSLTGELSDFIDVVINNANRVFPNKWNTGSIAFLGTKTLSFDNENALSALQKICKEFNTEFEISENLATGVKTLSVGSIGSIIGQTYKYGKGKGLYELSRTSLSDKTVVNRLYLFGGNKNIPSNYRDFSQRLKIAGDYIEDAGSISAFGLIEGVKTFEDIYPERIGAVSGVSSVLEFQDSSIDFNVNSQLISGVSAKVGFNDGGLAGYQFELKSFDNATKTFKLKPFVNEQGMELPSATSSAFQVSVGDKYNLTDILLPSPYISAAESKLQSEGQAYLDQNKAPRVQYSLVFDEYYFKDLFGGSSITNVFELGDWVTVQDDDLNVNGSSRVVGITRDVLYPYRYQLDISDSYEITLIEKIISEGKATKQIIKLNKLYDATKAKIGWRNTQELLGMVFDTDGYFDPENIKPLSIETSMLVVGVKSQQFILRVVIEPNFEGQKNVVKVNAGQLVHYTVEETIRTWQISEETVTIPDDNARYIYAKCNKSDGNDAFLLFSTLQIKPDDDATYYHFLVGVLHSVTEGVRWISLTYGATAINGRFIKTGRIQSFDGSTYFDLDLGEIGGKITFIDADGNYKNLEDLNQELLDFVNTTYPEQQENIQTQIDGKIEAWFTTSDPNTWPESDRPKHNGDMWYNPTEKKLYRYVSSSNSWSRIEDADAIAAYDAASQAQDTADGKRRVFVDTPYPPYDVGDLWASGSFLKKCITAREETSAYNPTDWDDATAYDNTVTTINGGIVTSGTIQVAGDDTAIKAGITGNGTSEDSVRFWSGASFSNRAIAPFRVLQSGLMYALNAVIEGYVKATSGEFGILKISGNSIINDFISQAQLVFRKDDEGQLSAFGTNVKPGTSPDRANLLLEQRKSSSGWNIAAELRASNSSDRNVALWAAEGESILDEANINGRTSKSSVLNNQNESIDVSRYDLISILSTGGASGTTFTGSVRAGKEVKVVNLSTDRSIYIYNTIRGYTSVEIPASGAVTCVYTGNYWYVCGQNF